MAGAELSEFVESSYAQIPTSQSLRAHSTGILVIVWQFLKFKCFRFVALLDANAEVKKSLKGRLNFKAPTRYVMTPFDSWLRPACMGQFTVESDRDKAGANLGETIIVQK